MNFERFLTKMPRRRISSKRENELLRGAVLSTILLQSEQLANGLWGASIDRYLELHNAQSTLGRSVEEAKLGSLTHSAHALRALATIGIGPAHIQQLWRTLTTVCVQTDGHIYPVGLHGPSTTNLSESSHTLAAARHTSNGIVVHFYCRKAMGSLNDEALGIPRNSINVLARHADMLLARRPPGYSHAYVLEALCYCRQAGVSSKELARFAVKLVKHLLSGEARETGLWQHPQTGNVSEAYFSSIIAERLLWALRSEFIEKKSRLEEAVMATIDLFVRRISHDYTDADSGGVCLDLTRKSIDYGTTARCARIAVDIGKQEATASWWRFLTNSRSCCGLTDATAHTGTWEANLLMCRTVLDKRAREKIQTLVTAFHGSLLPAAERLAPILKITDPDVARNFGSIWAELTAIQASLRTDGAERIVRKTIVELDLEASTDVASSLEEHLSATSSLRFREQIQSFVDAGLETVGLSRKHAVMKDTGDGGILAFDQPDVAHRFSEAVHQACNAHNQAKSVIKAKRWFRIGIATGDLALPGSGSIHAAAGSVIARAVRLETAAHAGEILADADTYSALPHELQVKYGSEEQVVGKRNERFSARRCVLIIVGSGDH
jgi:class 3 adenylate cyclase